MSLNADDLHQPLRLQADNFTDNQWGGDWIPRLKGLSVPSSPVGESWEFSAHPNHPSLVSVGGHAMPLPELLKVAGRDIFGHALAGRLHGAAPFLLKFIDSRDDLSVQVHPDDAYARAKENDNGKAESWIVLGTAPGEGNGRLYVGFDPRRADGFPDAGAFAEGFLSALNQANGLGPSEEPAVREKAERIVLPFLNRIDVKPGEVYDLAPGTVHAIGRGVRIFEIQQDSDVTYRVWDWNRPDAKALKQGRRAFRELHLDRAKDVLDFAAKPADSFRRIARPAPIEGSGDVRRWVVIEEPSGKFAADRIELAPGADARVPSGFSVLTVTAGETVIRAGSGGALWGRLSAGHSAIIPACAGSIHLKAASSAAEVIRSYVPG